MDNWQQEEVGEEVLVIAIDGPAGSGKSTISRLVARELGLTLVETGAIYRALALRARQEGISPDDEQALSHLARQLPISFRWDGSDNVVILADRDVSKEIRTQDMGAEASAVARHPRVRDALLRLQRELARTPPGAVLEGRDIGTVVLPDATFKFFVTATAPERARRRTEQLKQGGFAADYQQILEEINHRDLMDESRECAPLRKADDAVLVDTTALGVDQVVHSIVENVARSRSIRVGGGAG